MALNFVFLRDYATPTHSAVGKGIALLWDSLDDELKNSVLLDVMRSLKGDQAYRNAFLSLVPQGSDAYRFLQHCTLYNEDTVVVILQDDVVSLQTGALADNNLVGSVLMNQLRVLYTRVHLGIQATL